MKEAFGEVEFGKKLGLCSGCMYIGLAIGPALINLGFDSISTYEPALLTLAVLAAVMTLIFFAMLG